MQVWGCSSNFRSSVVFRHSNQTLFPNDGWSIECAQRNSGADWMYKHTDNGCSSKLLTEDATRCDCIGGGEIALLAFKMQMQVSITIINIKYGEKERKFYLLLVILHYTPFFL